MTKASLLIIFFGMITWSTSNAVAFDETLEVISRTLTGEEFLRGDANAGSPVRLDGDLSGPDGKEVLPVVVLLHGGDGPKSGAVWNWRRFLNGTGIATFSLDSYTGRGLSRSADRSIAIRPVHADIRHLSCCRSAGGSPEDRRLARGCHGVLARRQRCVLFGDGKISEIVRAEGRPNCRALAFLSLLQFRTCGSSSTLQAVPIREFHGADDDATPAAPCRAYVDRLADAGHDVQMTVYPDALHAFDDLRRPARSADPDRKTLRNCQFREENGQLVNAATGKPFTYADACVEYGASVPIQRCSRDGSTGRGKGISDGLVCGEMSTRPSQRKRTSRSECKLPLGRDGEETACANCLGLYAA